MRHLLTHTSGLHSYTEKPEFIGRVNKPIEPAELIAWFQNDPPDFAPGEGFHYNNSAYFLLGEIVAKVSGKSFGDYLRETFFEPLGMKDTGIYVNSAPPPGMAIGYSFTDEKFAAGARLGHVVGRRRGRALLDRRRPVSLERSAVWRAVA